MDILSLYCFNRFNVGNLKFPNSSVGSNSPKSFTNFFDKFSETFSSSVISLISISTRSSSFASILEIGSLVFEVISSVEVNTSE